MKLENLLVCPLPGRVGRSIPVVKAIRGNIVVLIGQDGRLYQTRSKYTITARHLSITTLRALEREKILDRGEVERLVGRQKKAEATERRRHDRTKFLQIARKYGIELTDGQRLCFSE